MTNASTSAQTPIISGHVRQIVQLLRSLCLAEAGMGMYPPDHPVAERFARGAYEVVLRLLQERGLPVAIGVGQGVFVTNGIPMIVCNPMIGKLAGKLANLRISTLFFQPGLKYDDFAKFVAMLGRNPEDINREGGLDKLVKTANLNNVILQYAPPATMQSSGKPARSTELPAADDEPSANAALINSLVKAPLKPGALMDKLIADSRDRPERTAGSIVAAMRIAIARAEDKEDRDERTWTVVHENIHSLCFTLAGSGPEGANAVLVMERDIRLRARSITASGASALFLDNVLSAMAFLSDEVRFGQVEQALIGDRQQKSKTEEVLRRAVARTESPIAFLDRFGDSLVRRGMDKAVIDALRAELGNSDGGEQGRT